MQARTWVTRGPGCIFSGRLVRPLENWIRAVAWASRTTPAFRGKERLLRWVHPCEERFDGSVKGIVRTSDGLLFHYDTASFIEWSLFFKGSFEPEMTATLRRFVRPGWTCVDAGANIGVLSLAMARAAGPEGMVYAFEPQPLVADRLDANLRLNGVANVRIERTCLGSSAGTVELFVPRQGISNVGQSSLYLDRHPKLGQADVVRHSVPMIRLDDFVRAAGPRSVDLIKIDVEGAEMQLLEGAAATLERWKPIVLFEANAETQKLSGSSVGALFVRIERGGYAIKVLDGRGGWSELLEAGRRRAESDPSYVANLLAIHRGLPRGQV